MTLIRNRVRAILTYTSVQDWKSVPGKENPADIASRGGGEKELGGNLWQNGPAFLLRSKKAWPAEPTGPFQHSLNHIHAAGQQTQADDGVDRVIAVLNRISEWEKVLNFAQAMLRPGNWQTQIETSLAQGCQFVVNFLISGILTFWGKKNVFPVFPSISGIFDILNFLYFAPCIFCFFG